MSAVGPTPFTTVKRKRSLDEIVTQIRTAVIRGDLQQNQRLPNERDLCQTFGVSRATLREALRVLEAFGVIEIRLGSAGGIFVSRPDGDHVGAALEALIRMEGATSEELAEFRVSFERETVKTAADRADENDVTTLRTIAIRFAEMAQRPEIAWDQLVELDIAFHEAVAFASRNRVRVAIMLGIHRALYRAESSLEPLASDDIRRSIGEELSAIAQAVAEGDGDTAGRLMAEHITRFTVNPARRAQAFEVGRPASR